MFSASGGTSPGAGKPMDMSLASDGGGSGGPEIASARSTSAIRYGAVAIGRNEGQRLVRCLKSLSDADTVVYVDSGSTDHSAEAARQLGATVVELDLSIPFTAARARNAGFARLRQLAGDLDYVQFVDGDCELAAGWAEAAVALLAQRGDIASVCGVLREREPERSIYNWLCDKEWNGPVGEIHSCAGNVMHRASALQSVGGYRNDVIAAEEDELCVRLRAANWRIWRLPCTMAVHDAAMTHFSQWWKRSLRAGYAFAQGAALHGAKPERHFVWESRRALLWGLMLPLACVVSIAALGPFALLALLVYPLQILRLTGSGSGAIADRASIALFQVIGRFPESLGVMRYERDRFFRRNPTIIEHKQS
jgi:GT2 family glycosyltransferase